MKKQNIWRAMCMAAAILLANPAISLADEENTLQEAEAEAQEAEETAVIVNDIAGPEDPGQTGKVVMTYKYGDTAISGAYISVTQIAEINVDLGRYYPIGKLKEAYGREVILENKTAAELQKMAQDIAGSGVITSDSFNIKAEKTDKDGKITFSDLKAGLYLFYQTGREGIAAGYEVMTPFILTVPQVEDVTVTVTKEDGAEETSIQQNLIYEYECLPKAELVPVTTPNETSETPRQNETLGIENESGNLMLYAGIAVVTVAGLLGIAMLASMFAPKKKK